VYVVGTTNAGKSSFLNRVLQEVTEDRDILTTSPFPGTTLDLVKIPLEDGKFLIDTPGVKQAHQMYTFVEWEEVGKLLPKKEFNPKIYQLEPLQTLFISGLIRLDYLEGERNSFTCYVSHELPLHRTKTTNANDFYHQHQRGLLAPGISTQKDVLLTRMDFPKQKQPFDIAISGVGWIHVAKPATIALYVPKGVSAIIREPLL
jgi:ribosome biogenesis GTPase A